MPQVRSLLNHVCVERAQRRRKCHRKPDEHSIEKGQVCLVVGEANGGDKNYCAVCAPEILKKAHAILAEFAAALGVLSRK